MSKGEAFCDSEARRAKRRSHLPTAFDHTQQVLTERRQMINVTTRINTILETAIAKPPTRNRWSRRAVARYLVGLKQKSSPNQPKVAL
jgi:hypothetical protein